MDDTRGEFAGVDGRLNSWDAARTSPRRAAGLRSAIESAAPDPAQPLATFRENFERGASRLAMAPADVVAAIDSPVDMEWVYPENSDQPIDRTTESALIYLHGGGFSVGSRRTGRPLASWLAHYVGLPVANVGYALTPESAFGSAVDDVESVIGWLAEHHGLKRYVLVGDSAGATLSLMSAIRLNGHPKLFEPSGLVLISPSARPGASTESHERNAGLDPQLPPALLRRFAELSGVDPSSKLWPGLEFGAELNLPPTLIHVGTDEVLLDDSVDIARMLLARGTDVTLRGWPEMIHVWHTFAPRLDDANQALAELGDWVRRVVDLPPAQEAVQSSSSV